MNISRTLQLNKNTVTESHNTCVIYVMSRDQRVQDNFALLEAQKKAQQLQVPLGVVFCLHHGKNGRAREHYAWMLEGLKQVEKDLAAKGIPFMLLVGKPADSLKGVLHHLKPDAIYFDMNTLRGPVRLQVVIAEIAKCPMYVVDTHNIVPVWEMSTKQEFAARTIRPKIQKQLAHYIEEPQDIVKQKKAWPGTVKTIADMQSLIDKELRKIPSNAQKLSFISGEAAAQKALHSFIDNGLKGYDEGRNDPSHDLQSNLSPYLHFGQLSRLRAYLEVSFAVQKDRTLRKDADAFLEELNIRSSLSDNFCYYSTHYDSLEGAADWAKKTLSAHARDKREQTYTLKQLERGATEDQAWNAAQHQLTQTGKMHGYMRMYWAKKLLEWSPARARSDSSLDTTSCLGSHAKELSKLQGAAWAIKVAITLNDFYSIDGGDPNGYVGVLWSIAGLHDRAWFSRPIFGSIRYMNYSGLQRKFDIASYIERFDG
jgi:deoxyribodipyrimidine photo-lyase